MGRLSVILLGVGLFIIHYGLEIDCRTIVAEELLANTLDYDYDQNEDNVYDGLGQGTSESSTSTQLMTPDEEETGNSQGQSNGENAVTVNLQRKHVSSFEVVKYQVAALIYGSKANTLTEKMVEHEAGSGDESEYSPNEKLLDGSSVIALNYQAIRFHVAMADGGLQDTSTEESSSSP